MKYIIFYFSLGMFISGCAGNVNRMSASFADSPPILTNGFYNYGAGFDIPGEPLGDRLFAFGPNGADPGENFTITLVNNRFSVRNMSGNKDIICHRPRENSNPYAVWKPVEVDFNPAKTTFLSTISVEPDTTVSLIFAQNQLSMSSGFNPSASDLAVLEISNNTLWAWEIGESFHGNSGVARQRLGNYATVAPRQDGLVRGEVLSVSFNSEENTCKVTSSNGINANLGPEFCNATDTSQVVMAARAASSFEQRRFCTSVMLVSSSR